MAKVFSSQARSLNNNSPVTLAQIVYAEVVEVLLDSDNDSYNPPGNINIGSIKARLLETERGKDSSLLTWYSPLNINNTDIPVVGEIVLLILAPNRGIARSKNSTDYYYMSIVSMFGNTTLNAIKGFSKPIPKNSLTNYTGNTGQEGSPSIGEYIPELAKSNLVAFEGDKIIQGRWGNSIRFTNTSNGSPQSTFWNSNGVDGDPLLIISNGHSGTFPEPHIESIDDDTSTMIMSSAQSIDMTISNKLNPTVQPINQHSDGQIILNSERLVLNAKSDSVIISGKKTVAISTAKWKADFTELIDIFKELLAEMKSQAEGGSPFTTGVGPTGPNPASIAILTILETRLGLLEQ